MVVPNDPNLGGVTGYYAYGTNTGGSSLPVMWTTDPINGPWVPRPAYTGNFNNDLYFNDALSAPYSPGGNQPPPWVIAGTGTGTGWETKQLQAPGAIRMPSGLYVVYFAGQDSPNHWCLGRATATNPWGPFTADNSPALCSAPDGSPTGLRDPQPFTDPSGHSYLIYKSEGVPGSQPTSFWTLPLDANGAISGSTATKIFSTDAAWQMMNPSTGAGVVENPAMVYYAGRYYLFYSGNDWTTDAYGTGYAICSGPLGPCTDQTTAGPLLQSGPGFTGAGGASPFVTPSGQLILGYAAWNVPGSHAGGTRTFHTVPMWAMSNGALVFSDPVANSKYVTAAYTDFLQRSPSSSENTFWTTTLSTGAQNRWSFMNVLTTSNEWVGATVDRMYVDTLGRPADPSGRAYWVDAITTGRYTVAQTAATFYSSSEYFNGIGGGTISSWIADLYGKLLGRSPDASGAAYWASRAEANGRADVAYAFFQSSESCHDRVAALYQELLGRAPDQGGWDYWANRVGQLGDLALAAQLGTSTEYYNRAQTR